MAKPPFTQSELQAQLQEFLAEEGAAFQLTALGYFGSYAREEARPDSDIDIVFATQRPNLLNTIRLQQALSAKLQRPVDVVRLHAHLDANFRQRIEKEAIYV